NALALVGLRRAHLADLGGRLADRLLVVATNDDLGRHRHLEGNAVARLDRHRMREAHSQLEIGPFEGGAIADALDLELLLEPVRDAFDHVRDQRAREPVQRQVLAALGRAGGHYLLLVLLDLHAGGDVLAQLAARAVHLDAARRDRHHHPGGQLDRSAANPRHGYQTKAITSPPTPRSAAWRLVMMPVDVDRIAVPRPPSTRGRRSLRA